ncbi:MAG: hypothetical protein P4L58_05355, partial [Candidatus Pacebacteria bacterium]|nr:hypothetical protein [Candidatus Paceibacterota bacterium]
MQVDDKKDVILPGTVVLQYVNDDETWAAIVVGDHMKCRLDNAQQEKFENRPDEYHICLILGIFLGYNKTWSIFSREDDLDYLFPNYRLERRGKATPIDLAEEIQLF